MTKSPIPKLVPGRKPLPRGLVKRTRPGTRPSSRPLVCAFSSRACTWFFCRELTVDRPSETDLRQSCKPPTAGSL